MGGKVCGAGFVPFVVGYSQLFLNEVGDYVLYLASVLNISLDAARSCCM